VSLKIPLPEVQRARPDAGHPYPTQVSLQTQELLQAAVFNLAMADYAVERLVEDSSNFEALERAFIEGGADQEALDFCWQCMTTHHAVQDQWVAYSAVVALRSHWDWYVSRLGSFVSFAREHLDLPPMKPRRLKLLGRLGLQPLRVQLPLLEESLDLEFDLDSEQRENLAEMSLVRNLIIHNRGEVDSFHLSATHSSGWTLGELRTISREEGKVWHWALLQTVVRTSTRVSEKCASVPHYSPLGGGA